MKKTIEKNMTISQQLGMVTLKNVLKIFVDYAVNFQLTTQESENEIQKEIGRLLPTDIIDIDGELFFDGVTEIVFMLHKDNEAAIRFYNIHDEILEVDCFKGFEVITSTFCK